MFTTVSFNINFLTSENLQSSRKNPLLHWNTFPTIKIQQWIFSRALEVFRGKKIDIKCDCCEYNDLIPNDFESIRKEKCFGKKSAYIIEKVVDEIVLAKARRESDGTYSA